LAIHRSLASCSAEVLPAASNRATSSSLLSASRAAHPWRKLLERHLPPDEAGERLWLYFPAGTTLAHVPHQEVAEAIIEPLDVREHAHVRMVRTGCAGVHEVAGGPHLDMTRTSS
jgi:hypothetical protein